MTERPVADVAAGTRAGGRDLQVQRRVAAVQTAAAGAALVGLAGVLVPWGAGDTQGHVDPRELFTVSHLATVESYARESRAWSWTAVAVSLAFAAVVGFTRVGRAGVARLPGRWWVRTVLAVVVYVAAQRAVTGGFRVGAWRLRKEAGLSTQGWESFLRDYLVQWAVETVALAALVLVLVGVGGRFVRSWTLIGGGLAAALVVVVSYAYPALVEPLFNDFTTMPEGDLRDRITLVAEREGVAIDDVVVADASRRTTTLNAWVSGFGGTRRIVLYDNLVEEVGPDEAMVIVAHELAHAKHDDVLVGTVLGAVGVVAAVGALGLLAGWAGGTSVTDPRVVPLVLSCLVIGSQVAAPVESAMSRSVEARADAEALCATGGPRAFERVQVRLATRALSDPTPPAWSQWWWGSHPTVLKRVSAARSWDVAVRAGTGVSRSCRS